MNNDRLPNEIHKYEDPREIEKQFNRFGCAIYFLGLLLAVALALSITNSLALN